MKQIEDVFEKKILIEESEDIYHALTVAKDIAKTLGFSELNQTLIATVTSELATNIQRYAKTGEIIIQQINDNDTIGIEIQALDQGPGIKDLEKAMQDGFSTTNLSTGLGLSSVKRIMDEFIIENQINEGVTIRSRKWKSENDH